MTILQKRKKTTVWPLNANLQPAVRAPSGSVAHGFLLLASSQVDLDKKEKTSLFGNGVEQNLADETLSNSDLICQKAGVK